MALLLCTRWLSYIIWVTKRKSQYSVSSASGLPGSGLHKWWLINVISPLTQLHPLSQLSQCFSNSFITLSDGPQSPNWPRAGDQFDSSRSVLSVRDFFILYSPILRRRRASAAPVSFALFLQCSPVVGILYSWVTGILYPESLVLRWLNVKCRPVSRLLTQVGENAMNLFPYICIHQDHFCSMFLKLASYLVTDR